MFEKENYLLEISAEIYTKWFDVRYLLQNNLAEKEI